MENDPNNSGKTGSTGSTTGTGASSTGFGSGGTGTGMNSGGGMSTGSGSLGGGTGLGTGGGTGAGTGAGTTGGSAGGFGTGPAGGFGVTSASEATTGGETICAHCGQSTTRAGGLEHFLGRLGITEEMITNLKGQFQNVDIDEYLNTARDYLKDSSGKATSYAKENPGKVAAGVAALALGAGLLYAAVNRDKEDDRS